MEFDPEFFLSMIPKRISIVTETYVPDVNGVAISLRHLIQALVTAGVAVQVIRTRPRSEWVPDVEEVWCRGLTIPMYPDLQIGLPATAQVKDAWDRFQPDLVYLVTEGPLGNSGLKIALQRNIPALSAFHTNFHRYSSYYGLGWVKSLTLNWLRRFHNRAAGTLVPSEEVAEFLREESFDRVQVLPHGVDCSLFNPRRRSAALRAEWGVDDDHQVMLYVGRIAVEKNIPVAFQAFERLRGDYPKLRLVVVGDGPMRGDMQRDHPDVVFAGVQTGETLARYFASADLFVFPSLTETFGLVTLEAMASALPVVAFDMAAAHQYVKSEVEGLLAPVDDNEAFIAAVAELLSRDYRSFGLQARLKAETLSWEAVGNQFYGIVQAEYERHQQASSSSLRTLV